MIKYSTVIVFLALALLDIFGVVSITAYVSSIASVLILIFIISCFMRINGASYFFLTLFLLSISMGALYFKDQVIAEKSAVWSYLFMVEGLSVSFFDYNSKSYTFFKKKK